MVFPSEAARSLPAIFQFLFPLGRESGSHDELAVELPSRTGGPTESPDESSCRGEATCPVVH